MAKGHAVTGQDRRKALVRRRRDHLAVSVCAACVAVAIATAALAVLAPATVDWGLLSLAFIVALLGAAIVGWGLGRRRANELALVAALAALATAGRVLFASLPNFKPVTFVVLVSGIALGPASGFMVGATTAVISNLFFGQGPWTPWQMLAWGLVGVVGGLMGHGGRRPGRWEIVLVGAALSVGFDWFVTVWMYLSYTAHSWPALVALYAQGLPFDAAHATATTLLAAFFGPRAVAIIARVHARTTTTFLPAARPRASEPTGA